MGEREWEGKGRAVAGLERWTADLCRGEWTDQGERRGHRGGSTGDVRRMDGLGVDADLTLQFHRFYNFFRVCALPGVTRFIETCQ